MYDEDDFASGKGENGDPPRGREAARSLQKVRNIKRFARWDIKKDKKMR